MSARISIDLDLKITTKITQQMVDFIRNSLPGIDLPVVPFEGGGCTECEAQHKATIKEKEGDLTQAEEEKVMTYFQKFISFLI